MKYLIFLIMLLGFNASSQEAYFSEKDSLVYQISDLYVSGDSMTFVLEISPFNQDSEEIKRHQFLIVRENKQFKIKRTKKGQRKEKQITVRQKYWDYEGAR